MKRVKQATDRRYGRGTKRDSCDVVVIVGEAVGGEREEVQVGGEIVTGIRAVGGGKRGATREKRRVTRKGRRRGGLTSVSPTTCRALTAVGHAQRARVMRKLLEGPATYQALQKVTKLKAGPLYHHISQLRLARLILPKQRDLYELTRGGRNLILTALAIGPVVRDARRRPVAKERTAERR